MERSLPEAAFLFYQKGFDFIKGLDLCEGFYQEAVEPILNARFPALRYTAGVLGYGSDVLGYDDAVSTDHMWGPRLYLFLEEQQISQREPVWDALCKNLPYTYQGYSVHFTPPDPNDNGVRRPETIAKGPVNPLIFLHTAESFSREYLGGFYHSPREPRDWLAVSEHRLLGYTSGRLFRDMLDFNALRRQVSFYPETVAVYLMASQWSMIAEEQAFCRRCADVGDDLGSRLAAARIAERIMRLCFLYAGRYAPYSKWFGTAFGRLPEWAAPKDLQQALKDALSAGSAQGREDALVRAQCLIGEIHNKRGITPEIKIKVQNYFNRKIKVIFCDSFLDALAEKLKGTPLENAPLIGSVSQVANWTALSDHNSRQDSIKGLYPPISAST